EVGVSIGTPAGMGEDDSSTLTAIAKATQRAVTDIVDDPHVALESAREHIPGTITDDQEEVMLAVIERTNDLYGEVGPGWGVPDLDTWEEMNTFMTDMGLIEQPVSLSTVVTNAIDGSE